MCPVDLVELVDDLQARIVCRHCGRVCPAYMQSCPNCLGELRPDPDAVAAATADIVSAGGHLLRAEGIPPFRDGPSCTLLRLAGRGPLVLVGDAGLVEAEVSGPDGRAAVPLTCSDVEGPVLFRLLGYEAAEEAVVAMDAAGTPLGTYLRVAHGLDVRDETSAPIGALREVRGGFELVETGGGVLAGCGTSDVELDGWVDDQWWLQAGDGRLPLRPMAAVALVVAAKVLLGRPFPVRVDQPDRWADLAEEEWS